MVALRLTRRSWQHRLEACILNKKRLSRLDNFDPKVTIPDGNCAACECLFHCLDCARRNLFLIDAICRQHSCCQAIDHDVLYPDCRHFVALLIRLPVAYASGPMDQLAMADCQSLPEAQSQSDSGRVFLPSPIYRVLEKRVWGQGEIRGEHEWKTECVICRESHNPQQTATC